MVMVFGQMPSRLGYKPTMGTGLSRLEERIANTDARDLFSVVRTMKSVAASSIEQYEKSVHALTDYYRAIELGSGVCSREKSPAPLPAWQKRGVASGVIVFGSDQGPTVGPMRPQLKKLLYTKAA